MRLKFSIHLSPSLRAVIRGSPQQLTDALMDCLRLGDRWHPECQERDPTIHVNGQSVKLTVIQGSRDAETLGDAIHQALLTRFDPFIESDSEVEVEAM
jgi:hypothetical protein